MVADKRAFIGRRKGQVCHVLVDYFCLTILHISCRKKNPILKPVGLNLRIVCEWDYWRLSQMLCKCSLPGRGLHCRAVAGRLAAQGGSCSERVFLDGSMSSVPGDRLLNIQNILFPWRMLKCVSEASVLGSNYFVLKNKLRFQEWGRAGYVILLCQNCCGVVSFT